MPSSTPQKRKLVFAKHNKHAQEEYQAYVLEIIDDETTKIIWEGSQKEQVINNSLIRSLPETRCTRTTSQPRGGTMTAQASPSDTRGVPPSTLKKRRLFDTHTTVGLQNQKIAKWFDKELFIGDITKGPTKEHKFYNVTYEDGDGEDLSEEELKTGLELYAAQFEEAKDCPPSSTSEDSSEGSCDVSIYRPRRRRRKGARQQAKNKSSTIGPFLEKERGVGSCCSTRLYVRTNINHVRSVAKLHDSVRTKERLTNV
jgi:hypothetical protein